MPPFGDTAQLATLTGEANWIVPGKPDQSRFYTVVTFGDDQVGAMPPTGHAITQSDADLIRAWIEEGAALPGPRVVKLEPQGDQPRSR
jgi:hypothetical protein